MSAALIESGSLELGVVVDGVCHVDFALRPATLADTYVATAAVPVPPDLASNESARTAYQFAVEDAVILCQLTRLGSLEPVPAVAALVGDLDPDDMAILRGKAASLKKKLRQSRNGSPLTGALSTSSSEPATA